MKNIKASPARMHSEYGALILIQYNKLTAEVYAGKGYSIRNFFFFGLFGNSHDYIRGMGQSISRKI